MSHTVCKKIDHDRALVIKKNQGFMTMFRNQAHQKQKQVRQHQQRQQVSPHHSHLVVLHRQVSPVPIHLLVNSIIFPHFFHIKTLFFKHLVEVELWETCWEECKDLVIWMKCSSKWWIILNWWINLWAHHMFKMPCRYGFFLVFYWLKKILGFIG